jgi:hypothetical protein
MNNQYPKITQDGKDGDEEAGYIANMRDGATAGFKYFDCKGVNRISVKTRGIGRGSIEVKTSWNGAALGYIPIVPVNIWKTFSADIEIPDGFRPYTLPTGGPTQQVLPLLRLKRFNLR